MAFSLGVELLNIRMRKRSRKPAALHAAYVPDAKSDASARATNTDSSDPALRGIRHSRGQERVCGEGSTDS